MTRSAISNLFSRHIPSERVGQALAMLEAGGKAKSRIEATEGRSIEIWVAR